MIDIFHNNLQIATFEKENKHILTYKNFELKNSISLSLPNTQKYYFWDNFPPYFETFLPEGYLFEIFKNLLTKKYGYIDEYLLFSLLSSNIEDRIKYLPQNPINLDFSPFSLDEILKNDTLDTFSHLLEIFLNKNAISGVQPKTIALIQDKETLNINEYIIKTWGEEFPYLAENEYFSLKAIKNAGVEIPNIYLSENKRFLVVEKFNKIDNKIWGFEEVLSLMNKNRIFKYQGSYEQVAKTITPFVNDIKSMESFYKTIVMNYLLKNGDAHLKNFGLLFNDDFSEIRFAPTYDVVTTIVYIVKDTPALNLFGKKIWWGKDKLVEFGINHCYLSKIEALNYYNECLEAIEQTIIELQEYIKENPHFEIIGNRMIDVWKINKEMKEIDNDVIRNWGIYKKKTKRNRPNTRRSR